MNRFKTLLLFFILILGLLLPLLRQTTSDLATIEEGIEYLGEKWLDDKLGIIYDAAEKLKERLFQEDQLSPLTKLDHLHHFFTYGFGYGLNSIGLTEKLSRDMSFKIYNVSTIIGALIVLVTFIQLLSLLIQKIRFLFPLLSLLNILAVLQLFGLSIKDPSMEVVTSGCLIFIGIHLVLLIISTRKSISQQLN